MSKVVVKLDSEGVRELLQSQEILDVCDEVGREIAKKANGNYAVSSLVYNRAVTRVETADEKTYYRNLHNNYLLKALK